MGAGEQDFENHGILRREREKARKRAGKSPVSAPGYQKLAEISVFQLGVTAPSVAEVAVKFFP